MGTRSLTYVHDDSPKQEVLVCIYQQFDGYPDGVGKALAEFLKPFKMVNGISGEAELGQVANGMGCLAAQLVSHLKDKVGGTYLHPTTETDAGSEYHYHIRKNNDNQLLLEIHSVNHGRMVKDKYVAYPKPKCKTIIKDTVERVLEAIDQNKLAKE